MIDMSPPILRPLRPLHGLLIAGLSFSTVAAAQSPDLRLFTGDPQTATELAQTTDAADSAAPPAGSNGAALGADTRAWLQLQASGNAAVGTARPLPGEAADAIYQRYLDSFTHPVPEQFERQGSGGSGQDSGGGGS